MIRLHAISLGSFNAYAIERFIEDDWVTRGAIEFSNLGDIFALQCDNVEDKHELLDRAIDSFDGALMVFERWHHEVVPRSVRFPYASVWVRVCGLPFEYLTMSVANVVGQLITQHFEVEHSDRILNADYLCIKASICLNEPLVPCFFLACEDGYLMWIQF